MTQKYKEKLKGLFMNFLLIGYFITIKIISLVGFILENIRTITFYSFLILLAYWTYLYTTLEDGNLIGVRGEANQIYLVACKGMTTEGNYSNYSNVVCNEALLQLRRKKE